MTDAERMTIAEQLVADWLDPADDAPHYLATGHPRLLASREMFVMALAEQFAEIEHATRQERSGGRSG